MGENFLSWTHRFHPPKSGGKDWREKCSHSTFTIIPRSRIKKKKKKQRESVGEKKRENESAGVK